MCSSTKAAGAGSSPPAHSDREPTQPGPFQPSSSRKRHHRQRPLLLPGPLDRLQPADHAERAVEASARGHRVEVRAGPDLRQLRPASPQAPVEVPRSVPLDLEPRLAHPAGRELVRLVLLGATAEPVRARPAADCVELIEPFEEAHRQTLGSAGPQRTQKLHPDEREHRREREPGAPRRSGDERPRTRAERRRPPPTAPSAASRSPRRSCARPASSAAAVNESPFHAIASPPARTNAGTSTTAGASSTRRRERERDAAREPDAPQRHDPRAEHVRPAAGGDAQHRREHLDAREHGRRLARREAALVVQEEHDEPGHRDLRRRRRGCCRRTATRAASRAASSEGRAARARPLRPRARGSRRRRRSRLRSRARPGRESAAVHPEDAAATTAATSPPSGIAVWRTPEREPPLGRRETTASPRGRSRS